jgi:glycosyltransferase involved in cell wall biosynthesis
MKKSSIWAVIPAFNEGKTIEQTVLKTRKHVARVVVVDDGSRDNTKKAAEKSGALVLDHAVNLGKGATLKTGCDYAVKMGAKFMVVLDADAQHDPDDIPRFMEKLEKCDLVFGYRRLSKQMPFILRFGNWFISAAFKLLYGVKLNDTQSGYRAFSANCYKKIRWNSSDYSMESEMIARAAKKGIRYTQIPIETVYSNRYKGTTILDGMKIVLNMLWWKLFNGNK